MATLLDEFRPSPVEFDPTKPDHLEAFRLMCVSRDEQGKLRMQQHPRLRFRYDRGLYSSAREMMLVRVGEHYLKSQR